MAIFQVDTMKAIISSTEDDKYLFFIPIVAWCWKKLDVQTICFIPSGRISALKIDLIFEVLQKVDTPVEFHVFDCAEGKEATYAQCSRLYAGALDLLDDEILVTSDADMALFKLPIPELIDSSVQFNVFGSDLVPPKQIPMCYVSAKASDWKLAFSKGRSLQQCLDELLKNIESATMKSDYWGKDQEEMFNSLYLHPIVIQDNPRARPGTQFASNRCDRDDINWRSYLGGYLVDAHLWRPGYTDENFANILELLQTQYPNDHFDWLIKYRNDYVSLL